MNQTDPPRPRSLLRSLAFACLAVSAGAADAQLNMTLEGHAGASTMTVTFSGTAEALPSAPDVPLLNIGWQFAPEGFDPFPAEISSSSSGMVSFSDGFGWIRNEATGELTGIYGIWLQDSTNSSVPGMERYGVLTTGPVSLTPGDSYEWGGGGTIDLSWAGLTFDALRTGSTGSVCHTGLCSELTVLELPEIPSSALLLTGFALLPWIARSRRARAAAGARP